MGDPSRQLPRYARDRRGLTVVSVFWRITRWVRALRFWLLLALAALAWLGFGGDARAQDYTGCYGDSFTVALCPSREAAYSNALRVATANNNPGASQGVVVNCTMYNPPQLVYRCNFRNAQGNQFLYRSWANECPPGTAWNESSKTCSCPPGTTPRPDGACKACELMNDEPGFSDPDFPRPFRERCLGGCAFRAKPMQSTCIAVAGGAAGAVSCTGSWEFTGASCSVGGSDPPMLESPIPGEPGGPDKPTRECINPGGGGMNVCIKPAGQHCYRASTGREICWKPGETGDKGDGSILQTRGPGSSAKPPANPATSSGDAYASTGESVTVTTTHNNTTITTTTTNFGTQDGTDADNQRDGSAEGEDSGSASGGGDCGGPPVVSDPALAMIATQAWATRCAVEAGNTAAVTGDVGDCASPFSVEGDNANAAQLRAMRVQICGSLDADSNGVIGGAVDGIDGAIAAADGADPDVSDGDVDDAADPSKWREVRDLNDQIGGLDDSGFVGTRACPIAPSVSVGGTSLGLNFNPICNMFISMSGLLIALAYVVAARIIAGVK